MDPYLRARLIETCTRLGLPAWETVLRPRLHARIAAQDALMAQVRADAMRVQGKRPRGRDGRFVGRARPLCPVCDIEHDLPLHYDQATP